MKIAILGTRGIPSYYSGFETCVQETVPFFLKRGHSVRVCCRRGRVGTDLSRVEGVKIVFLPFLPGKYSETFSHTLFSIIHLLFHPVDIVQLYGAGNGWFIPFLRLLGIKVVFMIDGIDWERAKWSGFCRWFLRVGGYLGVMFSHVPIVDSMHVLLTISKIAPHAKLSYVPYGAKIIKYTEVGKLRELGLIEREYFLFVGRFVPEKNVHLLVRAFEQAQIKRKLVLVGGGSYGSNYEKQVRSTKCDRILFAGFVYGTAYEELLRHCYVYVQPSVLEGTSPSLLAAMGAGACVLVSAIPENLETVVDAGFNFRSNDVSHLKEMLEFLDRHPQLVEAMGIKAQERVKTSFSWETVGHKLVDAFESQ